jgi:hypothetical protein
MANSPSRTTRRGETSGKNRGMPAAAKQQGERQGQEPDPGLDGRQAKGDRQVEGDGLIWEDGARSEGLEPPSS